MLQYSKFILVYSNELASNFWIHGFHVQDFLKTFETDDLHRYSQLTYENQKFLFLQFIENYQPWRLTKEFSPGTPKKYLGQWPVAPCIDGGKNFV